MLGNALAAASRLWDKHYSHVHMLDDTVPTICGWTVSLYLFCEVDCLILRCTSTMETPSPHLRAGRKLKSDSLAESRPVQFLRVFSPLHVHLTVVSSTVDNLWAHLADSLHHSFSSRSQLRIWSGHSRVAMLFGCTARKLTFRSNCFVWRLRWISKGEYDESGSPSYTGSAAVLSHCRKLAFRSNSATRIFPQSRLSRSFLALSA